MASNLNEQELERTIEEQVSEWSTNSNDCFNISVVRGDGSEHAVFQPAFTYPIFGEEEAIFGYQDLSINLTFAAHNLRPQLDVKYGKVFKAINNIKPTDVKEVFMTSYPRLPSMRHTRMTATLQAGHLPERGCASTREMEPNTRSGAQA
jgi:histone acetyltransferase 1